MTTIIHNATGDGDVTMWGVDGNISDEHKLCSPFPAAGGGGELISREIEYLVTKVLSAVYVPTIFLFGGLTNVANIVVFYKHGLHDRVNLCFFSLSIVDLLSISFYCLLFSEQMFLFHSRDYYGPVYTFLVNNNLWLFYNFMYCSTFLTTIISLERCLFVLFPLRSNLFLSTKNMAALIVVSVVVIGFLRLSVTAKYAILCFFDDDKKVQYNDIYITNYESDNRLMLFIVDGIVYGYILSLGCPIVILIATAITSTQLWQVVSWKKQVSSAASTKEITVTKMLIVLSVKYLLISLPRIFVRIVPWFSYHFSIQGKYRSCYMVCIRLGEALIYLGVFLNFIVYYFGGSKFRATLHSLMPGRRILRAQKSIKHTLETRVDVYQRNMKR